MKKIILAVCCLTIVQLIQAQRSPEFISPDRLFQEGRAMFVDGNYAGCIDKITEYKKRNPLSRESEESDFLLAASAFHQGQGNAGYILREFLDHYPETARRNEACFMLGSVFFGNHDYATADHWLVQCDMNALSETEQADYAYRRGLIHLQNNNDKEAGRLFALLNQYSPKYLDAAEYYLSYISYKEGDYDRALNRFIQIKNHKTFQPDVSYYITQIYFAQKKYEQVIQGGQLLLKDYPDHPYSSEIKRITGISYYQQGNHSQAIQYLQPLAEQKPLPSEWEAPDFYVLGISYYHLKDYVHAIRYLSQSNPGNETLGQSAWLHLGQAYLYLQDKTNALRAFESASRMDFDASAKEAASYNYAMLLHQTVASGFGESVTALEHFINTYPRSLYADRVNDALVDVYLTTKNYDTALASIAKIKNPGRKIMEAKQKIYYYLGTVDFTNGQYDSAINWFTHAIANGDYAVSEKRQAVYWRAESYYRKNDYTQATKDYRAFLSAGFTGGDLAALANYGLGYCAFKQGEYLQAESCFQTFIAQEKTDKSALADGYARLGDCYFNSRRFKEAEKAYGQAVEVMFSTGDYALFQKGYVMGLQKNYQEKIVQMDQLIRNYPQSPYVPDALYEKGRACVLSNDFPAAIETFRQLQKNYPGTQRARSAGLQMGLLYYNTNRLPQAASAYKEVIANYPGSEEARIALQDLKSVYFDQNDLTGYVDYVKSLGDKSLETESIRYSEEAVGRKAETFYNSKQYAEALQAYEQLQTIATGKTNRAIGALGVLRSAVQLNQYHTIINSANDLLSDETLNPEWTTEARYARAKAYLSLNEKKQAESDLEALARDTRTVHGAEARYLLAQYYFDTGNPMEARIVIQDYIQQGTPHAYWLAKSFILLSDIYAAEGDRLQARQYLESLQTNYKNTNDDIHACIKERLNKLKS
ncbi:MAG: tetratricopeptide repeat protein [Dysgonamonadaceae bacterium]|jgi:TolA-binding protein|nr:tetratricopeptide repeat protein [Dysgonamonadaceae bacterium]